MSWPWIGDRCQHTHKPSDLQDVATRLKLSSSPGIPVVVVFQTKIMTWFRQNQKCYEKIAIFRFLCDRCIALFLVRPQWEIFKNIVSLLCCTYVNALRADCTNPTSMNWYCLNLELTAH